MVCSRQEYWSGLPYPPPGDLANPGIEPRSPALQEDYLLSEPLGKPKNTEVGSLSLLQGIFLTYELNKGFPDRSVGKKSACNVGDQFNSWIGKIPWRRDRLPTPVFLGFLGGSDSKESTCNARDLSSIPGLGRSP